MFEESGFLPFHIWGTLCGIGIILSFFITIGILEYLAIGGAGGYALILGATGICEVLNGKKN